MTVEQLIYNHSRQTPQKTALIQGEVEVTYQHLWEEITAAASWFETHASAGDRVILSANKSLEFVYAYFGAHLAKMICVPIDPETNETRLNRIVNMVQPRLVLGELRNQSNNETAPFGVRNNHDGRKFEFSKGPEIADLLFTTGTTGLPKGVVLTYDNEFAAASNINAFIRNTADDVELLALPISHSFGLGRLRCVLGKGGTLVLLSGFASMKKFYGEIERNKVTGFGIVPASWAYMAKMSGDRIAQYASQLKYIEIGSAFMPIENKLKLMSLLPSTRICMHYGLTEASRSAFISFHDDKDYLASSGKPSPGIEIAVFNENGQELANGEDGEICVKGASVCSGYWGVTDDEFKRDFFGKFFRTGDWGHIDKDGYVYLVSRKKETINVGGKKVGPIEVEEQLNDIEGIEESACIGVHDDVLGEVVKAFCVCSKDIDFKAVRKTLQRKLESYKIPERFEVVPYLPKTQSGKLERLMLKNN